MNKSSEVEARVGRHQQIVRSYASYAGDSLFRQEELYYCKMLAKYLPGPTDLTHLSSRRGKLQAVVRTNWGIAGISGLNLPTPEFDSTLTEQVFKRLLSFSALIKGRQTNMLISCASCPGPVFCASTTSYWNQCLLFTPQALAISVWRTMIGTSQHRRLTLYPVAISSVKRWSYSNSRATICSFRAF